MKILIVGAGRLAGELARLLAPRHEIFLFDSRRTGLPHPLIKGDIREPRDVFPAVAGMDAVVHTAGIFGLHMTTHDVFEFNAINVGGTFNVLEACARHKVSRFVFASSAAVYGHSKKDHFVVDEATPCRPINYYGLTKLLGEQLCAFYADRYDFLRTTILRYTAFYDLPRAQHGPALLYDRVDPRDAARATALALEKASGKRDVYLVAPRLPFRDAKPALDAHWPGASELLAKHKLEAPAIEAVYDVGKAERELGFVAEHDFGEFLAELRAKGLTPADYEAPRPAAPARAVERLRELAKRYRDWRLR